MMHLLQQVRNEESLQELLLEKIKSVTELVLSKSNYERSESKLSLLFKERMRTLERCLK